MPSFRLNEKPEAVGARNEEALLNNSDCFKIGSSSVDPLLDNSRGADPKEVHLTDHTDRGKV